MIKNFHWAMGLAALALVGVSGCKKSGGGGSSGATGNLATVDGDAISMDEFDDYLQRKPTVQGSVRGQAIQVQVIDTLGIQAMKDLIQQQLLIEVAKDDGVVPTNDDVTKELNFRTKQNPSFVTNLQGEGLSLDEIRHDLMVQLAQEKILTKGITVSDAETKQFIASNKKIFTTPAQVQLLFVVVGSADKKAQVDKDMSSGQTFNAVALKYSEAPNARSTGAKYPITNVQEMPAALQKIVGGLAEGKTSSWIQDGTNWVKFYAQSKQPSKPMTIDATLIEAVQRDLARRKSKAAPQLDTSLRSKIKSAKIEFPQTFYQDAWKRYVEQLAAAANAAAKNKAPQ